MSASRWLRSRSQHYLLITAQEQMSRRYGTTPPRKPHGAEELFWRRIFSPIYRALPWPVRHKILLAMPGSHRQQWAPPPKPRGPAV
jgi:hypothetical protein